MRPSRRMIPALLVALFAGILRATQLYVPQLATSQGMHQGQLSLILPALSLLSLSVSPFGAVIAGYVWGSNTDVQNRWPAFVLATIFVAFAGFLVTSVLLIALLARFAGPTGLGVLVRQFAYSLVSGLGLVSVGLIALAGGAIATFRSG